MGRNEVSLHELQVYQVLRANQDKWMTNREIAGQARTVSERTVRLHTRRLVGLGLIDHAEVFPAHRYRWAPKGEKRNQSYVLRLQKAADAFGLDLGGSI